MASQARHELDAPNGLFAGAKRGRESSRKFTKVRTDQARNSAMLRIVTGETFFSETGDF